MTALATGRSPSPSPGNSYTPAAPARYLDIRADLLPHELVLDRRVARVKRRAVIALVLVVLLLGAWYALARWSTAGDRDDLRSAQQLNAQLLAEQQKYQPLVDAQNQTTAINNALKQLMVGDLSWTDMLITLRAKAPNGVQIGSVTGTITSGAATANNSSTNGGLSILNESGKPEVGTLTINGSAADKNQVAAYVDSLGKVSGLASPFPASVTSTGNRVSFSVQVIITSDALGGRYADTPTGSPSSSGGN
jgi:Tfp pilus assembly protein PilN